jgi:hypothetical protein
MAIRRTIRLRRWPYPPHSLVGTEVIIDMVSQELDKARLNFDPMTTYHEGIAVIREEYLELESEVFNREQDRDKMRKECIHLAAMAIRFLEDLL